MLTPSEIQSIIAEVTAGTYDLVDALDDIAQKQKGEDVRKALYSLAYVLEKEGKAGSVDLKAREDLEEVDERLTAQMAAFIANHAGTAGETTLWTGSVTYKNQTITLSEACDGFDYIDVYWDSEESHEEYVRTFSGEDFKSGFVLVVPRVWHDITGDGTHELTVEEIIVDSTNYGTLTPPDGIHYAVRNSTLWYWSGNGAEGATTSESTSATRKAGTITKIVGRKFVADAEVVDMRTGADGTEYVTAGDALRAQAMVIDDTLSAAGEAADAKAVGDEISALQEELLEIYVSGASLIINGGLTNANEVDY